MQFDTPLLIVSVLAGALLVALLWVWKRYADVRADHEEQLKKARQQSVRQSRSGLLGNAFEQIAPLTPMFCEQFSPSDARFLGAPIDYVIFDGLHRGQVERVVFLEVKSGANAGLNKNEREVRRAIQEGLVAFEVLSLSTTPRVDREPRPKRRSPDGGVSVAGAASDDGGGRSPRTTEPT